MTREEFLKGEKFKLTTNPKAVLHYGKGFKPSLLGILFMDNNFCGRITAVTDSEFSVNLPIRGLATVPFDNCQLQEVPTCK